MSKIKMIALDMDGTLLNDDELVTDYTKQMIKQALNKGIHVVISTGRPLSNCISYVKDLHLSPYVITSNGAEIFTVEEQLVEQHTMNPEKIKKLWEIGDERNIHMWLVATDTVFRNGERPDNFHDYHWLKMGYGKLSDMDKQYVIEKLDAIDHLEITNSTPTNFEVNEAGVNKANAIESVCKLIGISIQEVLAMGDSLNDFKMLKQVGIGVAVGNAQKEILEIADYVTSTNNEDGVAKAIERHALS